MTRLKHGLALTNRYAARRTLRRALLVLFGMPVFFTALMLTSAEVLGQDKWMVTPSRGGAEGAKQNAQLTTINNEFSRMNACTGVGRIYAPTHPSADVSGCVTEVAGRSLSADIAVGGSAAVSGTLSIGSGHIVSSHETGAIVLNAVPGTYDGIYFRRLHQHNAVSPYTQLMTITGSGDVGIGQTSPTVKLDVDGAIKIAGATEACNSVKAGAIRYNPSSQQMEFCNGSVWGGMGGAVGGAAISKHGSGIRCPSDDFIAVCGYAPGSTWNYNVCYSRGHAITYGWTLNWNSSLNGYQYSLGGAVDVICANGGGLSGGGSSSGGGSASLSLTTNSAYLQRVGGNPVTYTCPNNRKVTQCDNYTDTGQYKCGVTISTDGRSCTYAANCTGIPTTTYIICAGIE